MKFCESNSTYTLRDGRVHKLEIRDDLKNFFNFNEKFDYGLTQMLTANPMLINDNDFFPHKEELRISIDSGNQAFTLVGDIFAAQQCYDRATELRVNSQYYFNINA